MLTTSLKGLHMDITPAIRSYAEEKMRMLTKFINAESGDVFIEIELGKTTAHHQHGDVFRAEITMKTPHRTYRAATEKEDLYVAIDIAKDELAGELTKDKKKRETMIKKGGRTLKDIMRKIGIGE